MKYFTIMVLASLFAIPSNSQTLGDYRSSGNVSFTTTTNWQVLTSLPGTWTAATTAPASNAALLNGNTITIQAAHTLTYTTSFGFAANTNFTIIIQGGISSSSNYTVTYGSGLSTVRIEQSGNYTESNNVFQNQSFNNLVVVGTGGIRNFNFSSALNIRNSLATISSNISLPSLNPTSSSLSITAAGNITVSGNPNYTNKTINATLTSNNALFQFQGTLTLQGSTGSTVNATFSGTGGTLSVAGNASLTNSTFSAGFAGSSSSPGLLRFNGTVNLTGGSTLNLTGDYAQLANNSNSTSLSASTINLLNANQRFDISAGHTLSFSNTSAIKLSGANDVLDFAGNVNINGANATNYIQLGPTSKVVKQISQNNNFAFPIGTSANYLPVTITSDNGGGNPDFTVGVFQGATTDAQPGGPSSFKPPIVDAVWNIQQDGNNSKNVILAFGWQNGLEGNVFSSLANSQLGIGSYNTSTSSWNPAAAGTGINGNTNTFSSATIVLSGSNGLNSFAIAQIGIILPLITRDFTAATHNGQVTLTWTGAATRSRAYFEVERSSNAENQFKHIATIPVSAVGDANYQYVDAHPSLSENFYRIKLIDDNNRITYTKPLKVNISSKQFALDHLYPTLASNQVNLSISSTHQKQVRITILDQLGRTVQADNRTISAGSQLYPVNVHHLAGGQYFLLLNNGDEIIQGRFIKQ